MFRFAPVLPVVSTQKVNIEWLPTNVGTTNKPVIWIDNRIFYDEALGYGHERILTLANNDGFDTVEDFFAYFNTEFEGKIIHWTKLRY